MIAIAKVKISNPLHKYILKFRLICNSPPFCLQSDTLFSKTRYDKKAIVTHEVYYRLFSF